MANFQPYGSYLPAPIGQFAAKLYALSTTSGVNPAMIPFRHNNQ
ncbi:hypothetical protein [Yersinia sp. 1652 StPb PI]